MMNSSLRPDATLPEYLAARARAASDERLVLDAIAGALVAIGVGVWRPPGWITLVGAAVALVAYALWGIADRELRERSESASTFTLGVLRALRIAVAMVGFLSMAVALFAGLTLALGTWIS